MRKFMSASEAAAVLGVSGAWARQLAASGQIEAERTSAGWMLDADAVAREAAMRRKFGRISPGEAQKMLASFSGSRRDEMASVLELLTDDPQPIRATAPRYADVAASASDDELDDIAALYPPRDRADAERRERIAASRPRGDGELTDEEWARVFGAPRRVEDE